MATTTIIPLHIGKGRTVAKALGLTIDYVKNPNKTDGGEWVTAFEYDPLIVDEEFCFSKRQYAAVTGRDQGSATSSAIISASASSRGRPTLRRRTKSGMI